jgi:hypothetical protein
MRRISIKSNSYMGYSKKWTLLVVMALAPGVAVRAQLESNVLQAGLDQLAELHVYATMAKEGYKIVEDGWRTVANIRQGEWDLHQAYYGSLLTVDPAVRRLPEIARIIQWAVRKKDAAALADLTALLTDGQLRMTDGERIRRVAALRERLK